MTIFLDTPIVRRPRSAELDAARPVAEKTCDGAVGWLVGMEALRRPASRSDGATATLERIIERDIIPRLFLTHRDPRGSPAAKPADPAPLTPEDCEAFASLLVTAEAAEILERVQGLIDRGIGLSQIYLDLLAPAARRLGELWEEDRCSFTEVTLGLSHLHLVLRDIGRRNGEDFVQSMSKRQVYLVPAPGEQHTFGLSMVEEFFLQAGWQTECHHTMSAPSVLHDVSHHRMDLLGFSLGCAEFLKPLLDLIAAVQRVTVNPDMIIMIGGNCLIRHPELTPVIDGVIVVSDAINALNAAERMVAPSG